MTERAISRRQLLRTTGVTIGGCLVTGRVDGSLERAKSTSAGQNQTTGSTVYTWAGHETAPKALYAVDTETGEQRWAFLPEARQRSRARSPPLVVDGTVYLGLSGVDDTAATDGGLLAVDAVTGERQWLFETESAVSPPTVVDGTVYVSTAGTSDADRSDSVLYALDANTAETQWTVTDPPGTLNRALTVADGMVYVVSNAASVDAFESTLYAIEAETGDQSWSETKSAVIFGSPLVVGGTVYLGGQGPFDQRSVGTAMYAIDAATGDEQWTFDVLPGAVSIPTVVGDTLYVAADDTSTANTEESGSGLYAIKAATGGLAWTYDYQPRRFASPTVANGTVYVGGDGDLAGAVHAVDARTGDEQWSGTLSSAAETASVTATPTVADGTIYAGSFDNGLYALDASTGDQQWAFTDIEREVSAPTVVLDPESGNSIDTRVLQGTFGHHGQWRHAGQTIEVGAEPDGQDSSGGGPGEWLSTPGRVAAVSGGGLLTLLGGYAVKRRIGTQTEDSETHETAGEKPQEMTDGPTAKDGAVARPTAEQDAIPKDARDRLATARTHLTYAKRADDAGNQERARKACKRAIETAESIESNTGEGESVLTEARELQKRIG